MVEGLDRYVNDMIEDLTYDSEIMQAKGASDLTNPANTDSKDRN